jgi:hypothetical protein
MNTSDIKVGTKHYTLFKGLPGTGKSIAAHSYHELGPTYTLDLDEKMDAVAGAFPSVNFEFEQFNDVFAVLNRLEMFKKSCPFKTIILDGWHSLARLALTSVLNVRAPGRAKIMKGNIEAFQIDDYGAESRAIEQVLGDLKYIYKMHNVNIITIAHIIYVERTNIITNATSVYEGLFIPGGKIAFAVPVGFNELYKFTVENNIDGSSNNFMCYTIGEGCKTVLKVPEKFNWTMNKNGDRRTFYQRLMESHERESKVISL